MAPVLWIRQRDSFDTESSDETPPIPNPSNVSETGSKRKTDSPAPTSIPKPTSTAFGSVEEGGWLDFLNFGSDEQKSRSRGASAEKSETFTSFASPTSTHDNARLPDPTHSEEGLGSNIIKAVEGVFDGGKDADTESRGFFPTPSGRSQQLSVTSTTSSVKPTETRPPSEVVGEKIDEVKIAAAACDGGFSLSSPECVQSFNEHPARTVGGCLS
ncbi:hypothetical protein QFC24_006673 [Naganishia onofrii]|uniref:Uncharacterized protein n=1 Tax=Naganishia onofrii TaxID=1851511 RepID=A0ACC2WYR3_9TREE|nr:hypothetical protein QFC24_006673 [Naganishia onofrii]